MSTIPPTPNCWVCHECCEAHYFEIQECENCFSKKIVPCVRLVGVCAFKGKDLNPELAIDILNFGLSCENPQ